MGPYLLPILLTLRDWALIVALAALLNNRAELLREYHHRAIICLLFRQPAFVHRILLTWPHFMAAQFFFDASIMQHEHHGVCLPCAVRERRAQDSHTPTDSPVHTYCSKCGLDEKDWTPRCANKVLKVNNPKPRHGVARILHAFWN